MSRQKKTRKISDIMPMRKSDKPLEPNVRVGKSKKPSRYELDLQAREAKKKRKHKGLPSGARLQDVTEAKKVEAKEKRDPRLGSRKKVPLVVEFVNKPEKGQFITPVPVVVQAEKTQLTLAEELAQLENNECLHQLLDELEAGKTLSLEDQKFLDNCLDRIDELMSELGIEEEESEDALLRQFETIDINKFR